jgi:type VII secretion protein EccB
MQSRRDQVQAQSYLLGRLTAALVTAELDTLETPHRRSVTGLIGGVLVAALVVGGFTVYGMFVPGGATSWREAGKLVVEKETGSQYLYLEGRLRPVLNYASARLLIGEPPKVDSVSAASLAGTPRGTPIGIVGAPDSLPAPSLGAAAWTACAPSMTDAAGLDTTALTLAVGPAGDDPVVGPDRAVPVRAAGDDPTAYLIWNGHRFRLTAPWVATVLGYDGAPATVPAVWLDLIPAGADLGPVEVAGRGDAGPAIDGRPTRVGQLFTAGDDRYYLLRADGISRLTATAYAVLSGDPATARAYPGGVVTTTPISPAALARLPVSPQVAPDGGFPGTPPPAASADGLAWCLRSVTDGAAQLLTARPAPASGIVRIGVGVTRTARTADAVTVAAGVGGLAVTGRPGEAPGTGYFLVTDAGVKYPLAGAKVAETLGYPPTTAVVVSPDLLDLLPTGPVLDPARVVG